MQTVQKPKKQRRKKRAPKPAVSAGIRSKSSDPYKELKVRSSGASGSAIVIPQSINYDVELAHRFDEMAPREVGGRKIARYSGRMPLAQISEAYNSSYGSGCLYPLSTAVLTEVIHLNPIYIVPSSSPEFNVFNAYTKFRFTKLKLIYQGMRQGNTNGQVVLGYYNDGAINQGDVSATSALYTPGSMISSLWIPLKSADVTRYLTGGDWFYMDYDTTLTASDADWRLSFQGAVFGVWYVLTDTLPALGLSFNCGQLWLEYEIELNGPRYAYNVALLSKLRPFVEDMIRGHKTSAKKKVEDAKSGLERLVAPEPELLEEPDVIRVQLAPAERGSIIEGKRSESKTRR